MDKEWSAVGKTNVSECELDATKQSLPFLSVFFKLTCCLTWNLLILIYYSRWRR